MAQGATWGYDRQSIREPLASFFYQNRITVSKKQHAIERIRQLLALALNYSVSGSPDYGLVIPQLLTVEKKQAVVFLHATARDEKLWPVSHWQALAKKVTQQNLQVLLPWGNENERLTALAIANNQPNVKVLDAMKLTQLAQLLQSVQAVVAVDTGLAHLTAALNKSAIVLYGPTDPDKIGTIGKNQTHIKAKNHQLSELSCNQVWAHLSGLL